MKLDARIRKELTQQSDRMNVVPLGEQAVMATAESRTRRARMVGTSAVVGLVVLGAGLAIGNRDSDAPTVVATGDVPAGATDPEPTAPDPADGADSGAGRVADDSPAPTPQPSVATTEAGGESTEPPSDGTLASGQIGPVAELVAHKDGFIALSDTDGSKPALWVTVDGNGWRQIGDPRPAEGASIALLTSYDGQVFVAGDQPNGRVTKPWIATSTDLENWDFLEVPEAFEDGSEVVDTYARISTLASGPAGLIAIGETVSDLALEELLDEAVILSGSWSLGDSSGDLSKLIVYDDAGDATNEIDLFAAGVPLTVIDTWSTGDSVPFVGIARNGLILDANETTLPAGTLLRDADVSSTGFASGGFSAEFSRRVLWESADGVDWSPLPVDVVTHDRAEVIGSIGDGLLAVTGVGPLLTLQHRSGDEWTEVRLDLLFGDPDSDYELIDLAFHPTGAVGVVATVGESGPTELWVLTSDDGASWAVEPLGGFLTDSADAVHSVGISANAIAIAYENATNTHNVVLIDR